MFLFVTNMIVTLNVTNILEENFSINFYIYNNLYFTFKWLIIW